MDVVEVVADWMLDEEVDVALASEEVGSDEDAVEDTVDVGAVAASCAVDVAASDAVACACGAVDVETVLSALVDVAGCGAVGAGTEDVLSAVVSEEVGA